MKRKDAAAYHIKKEYNQKRAAHDELKNRMAYQFRYESDRQLTMERIIELEGYLNGLEFALRLLEDQNDFTY